MPVQSQLHFSFELIGSEARDAYKVVEFGLKNGLIETFHLAVNPTSPNHKIDFGLVLDRPARLTLWHGDNPVRYVHGASHLHLGYLTRPRPRGGQPSGEGFELQGDRHGARRAERDMLLSTDTQGCHNRSGSRGRHCARWVLPTGEPRGAGLHAREVVLQKSSACGYEGPARDEQDKQSHLLPGRI
ncbi:type VI secretion system Vgr family protein [Achromobacter spanius]|uniref:type VI secretion system Vgr family protein n=1 Tax=Achromobacter spanius TaxID=217203 RepID=UPI003D34286F